MRRTVCLLLTTLPLTLFAACGEIGQAGGAEGAEQGAVRMYSDRVKALDRSEEELQAAWKELGETKTLELFARRLRTSVIAKLRSHIGRLSAIKPALPDLAGVHKALVDAYSKLERELQDLADMAEKEQPEALKAVLVERLDRARAAELAYRQDVDVVYAKHGFRVANRVAPERANESVK